MKKILFDMDGVLCEPRQQIPPQIFKEFDRLIQKGYLLGIVTGSHLEYLEQQLNGYTNKHLTLFPCNGLNWYWYEENKWKKYGPELNIKNKITPKIQTLIEGSLIAMWQELRSSKKEYLYITHGESIQLRPNLINLCPIGRNSDSEKRLLFQKFDKETGFREYWLAQIRQVLEPEGFEAVLGGVTSFDIYPKGWNKTMAGFTFPCLLFGGGTTANRNNFVYFGNSFFKNGNDACMLNQPHITCIEVTKPEETLEILKRIK